MSKIIEFFLPLIYLLGFTGTLVILTKKSFGKCLPLTLFATAFLLFFSQIIFQTFNVGFAIAIIFAVASLVLTFIKRKDWVRIKTQYFTSGMIVFLLIYCVVFIYDFSRGFTVWDEFSHWGMMLKEMFRLDKFYYVEESNLMVHKDYPPIMQLFELFWMKICGFYSEALAERAVHTFGLSLCIPFAVDMILANKNKIKTCFTGLVVTIILTCIVLLFDQHGVLQTVYTDYIMAILVAFLVVYVLLSQKIDWFDIALVGSGGAFLLLLKQMGLPLYMMVLCILVAILISRGELKEKEFKKDWKKILAKVAILLIPFLLWFLWGQLVKNTVQQFNLSEISIGGFIKALLGEGEAWQRAAIKNFIVALGGENISTSFVEISYMQGVVGFIGLLSLLAWSIKEKKIRKEIIIVGVILILGSIGYAFAMMILYATSFGEIEGPALASFDRYMGTYLMALYITLLFMVIYYYHEKRLVLWVILFVSILLMSPTALRRLYPEVRSSNGVEADYNAAINTIEEGTEEGSKVFIIAQENGTARHYYLQYFLGDINLNDILYTWNIELDAEEYFMNTVWPEMKDYDYLFVDNIDEEFKEKYYAALNCTLEERTLYNIERDENGHFRGIVIVDTEQ